MNRSNSNPWDNGVLRVSENKRYLMNGSEPFFWMGDTAWLLFQSLNGDECRLYFKNRRAKHFNIILASLVHSMDQGSGNASSLPQRESRLGQPLIDGDFARPDLDGGFWQHIDSVVAMAEKEGLYMGLLPCWGAMVKQGYLNEQNAEEYGRFLAQRYGSLKNIVWILGGDIRGSDGYGVWMKLAATLKKHCPDKLIGFHPFGRTSSSLWFNEADWLDFNMFQSGHRRYDQGSLGAWDDNSEKEGWFGEDNWKYVERDYAASVKRPTLDGEPSYEQILQGLHDVSQPYWQAHDVRRYAYWSVFEGACGHTYGDNSVMQFYIKEKGQPRYGAREPWQEAIHHEGSGQMGVLCQLINSVNFTAGRSAGHLLAHPQREKYGRVAAFAGEGFAFFYTYTGECFSLELSRVGEGVANFYWFNPEAGIYSFLGEKSLIGTAQFTPPVRKNGQNDWVLVIRW